MSDSQRTLAERVASLEMQMIFFMSEQKEIREALTKSNAKLDELLTFRNKGVGAFWVFSTLAGTGVIGLIYQALDWLKGFGHG